MAHRILLAVVGVTSLAAANVLAADMTFAPLPLEHPVTSMAISEDHELLFVAHEAQNQIVVWSVDDSKVVERIACPSPRYMLCRDDKLFVACYGRGAIRLFSHRDGWKPLDEINAGVRPVDYISAPAGKNFANVLLAVGGEEHRRAVHVVDMKANTAKRINKHSSPGFATYSHGGDLVVEHVRHKATFLPVDNYLLEASRLKARTFSPTGQPMYQVRDIPWWFGTNDCVKGQMGHSHVTRLGLAVIPDQTESRCYVVESNEIAVCKLDTALTEIARFSAEYPKAFTDRYSTDRELLLRERKVRWRTVTETDQGLQALIPVAVTKQGKTTIFLTDPDAAAVYSAVVKLPAATDRPVPSEAIAESEHQLRPVPTEHLVTDIAVTPDNRQLLVLCEEADKIMVLDMPTDKQVAEFETASPSFAICRGERTYVANGKQTQISIFDSGSWERQSVISLPADPGARVIYLSAPGGEYFDDKLIATVVQSDVDRHLYTIFAVDLKTGKSNKLRERVDLGEPRVDFRGESVLEWNDYVYDLYWHDRMGDHPQRPGENIRVLRYRPSGGNATEDRYQIADHIYWFDQQYVFAGFPPMKIWPMKGELAWLAPDRTRNLVYRIGKQELTVHALDDRFTHLVQYPLETDGPPPNLLRSTYPIAATHGEQFVIYMVNQQRTLLAYRARTPDKDEKLEAPPGKLTGANKAVAIIHQSYRSPPLAGSEAGAEYLLMKGPEGSRITQEDVIEWTPTVEQLGMHQFKIKAKLEDKVAFLRFDIEVIDADPNAAVAETLSAGRALGKHYVLHPNYEILPALNGNTLLLFEGSQIRVLDAEGLTELRTLKLPHNYRHLRERDHCFVAVGSHFVDLIDKATFMVQKRIELDCYQTRDLAIDPSKPICYVATEKNNPDLRDEWLRQRPIVMVDERRGRVQETGVYGTSLAMDPRGSTLHALVHGKNDSDDGNFMDVGPNASVLGSPHPEMLVSYKASGRLRAVSARPAGLRGVMRLALSPDGNNLACVSTNGYRGADGFSDEFRLGQFIANFPSSDVAKTKAIYDLKEGQQTDMAYHPTRDIVAAATSSEIHLFETDTGKPLEGLIDVGRHNLTDIKRLWFSVSGRHLLVDHVDEDRRRVLVALNVADP